MYMCWRSLASVGDNKHTLTRSVSPAYSHTHTQTLQITLTKSAPRIAGSTRERERETDGARTRSLDEWEREVTHSKIPARTEMRASSSPSCGHFALWTRSFWDQETRVRETQIERSKITPRHIRSCTYKNARVFRVLLNSHGCHGKE